MIPTLLDTHTFIWLDTDASKLSATVRGYLTNNTHLLLLSMASAWEMAIKVGTGKLILSDDLAQVVRDQISRNPIQLLPITLDHALAVRHLPSIHRDPFDRMLVAQAMALNAVILTKDPNIRQYPVRTDW